MNKNLTYFTIDKPILYITGYGFEDRAKYLLSLIKHNISLKYSFAIGFPSSSIGYSIAWQRNKAFTDDVLTEISENYEIINISVKKPVQIRQNLQEKFSRLGIKLQDFHVIIDISSLPKATLFMILKHLTELGASGHLYYIEPIDYELPISLGVKDIRTLPFFGDDYDPKKQKLLIEILGFEGLRAYAIWETFDPHKTISLIGVPSESNAKWKGISERENHLLLSRSNVEKRKISFTSIKEATTTLNDIYSEFGDKYNIIISTLGTKLSAIPLFYFANQHKNVFITFSRPEQHCEHYSYGSSQMVVISFNKDVAQIIGHYDITTI